MAVKKDMGLNKYEINNDLGVTKLLDQAYSCAHL